MFECMFVSYNPSSVANDWRGKRVPLVRMIFLGVVVMSIFMAAPGYMHQKLAFLVLLEVR